MARIIEETKPKAFIAENVKGFYRLKQGYYFDLACKQFESIGYTISHKLINSSDFGVPQKRERIFIVGIRKDLKKATQQKANDFFSLLEANKYNFLN